MVHPHWKSYPPAAYPFHATVGFLMFLMFLAGVVGNTLVLVVYNR